MSRILRQIADAPGGTGASGGAKPPETPPAPSATPAPEQAPSSPSARGAAPAPGEVDLSDLPDSLGDAGREAIRREREARASAEARARAAETKLSEKERAELSELERERADRQRLEGEVQRLTEEARGRRIREAVADLAPRLGIGDPKLAARLIDSTKIEFDEAGEPKAKKLEATLEDLKREYPSIVHRPRGSADAGAGASSTPADSDISARIRARLRGEG